MSQRTLILALCGISMLLMPEPSRAQTGDKSTAVDEEIRSQIRALDQQLNEAAVHGNLELFATVMAPNYVGVAPNGMILEKSFIASRYQAGSLHYDSVSDSEVDIRVNGECAVLTALSTVRGHDGDTDLSGTYRIMRVFLRRDGKWQIIAFQATAMRGTGAKG
jgi:uncharacterized protein (TIGR02246 family)